MNKRRSQILYQKLIKFCWQKWKNEKQPQDIVHKKRPKHACEKLPEISRWRDWHNRAGWRRVYTTVIITSNSPFTYSSNWLVQSYQTSSSNEDLFHSTAWPVTVASITSSFKPMKILVISKVKHNLTSSFLDFGKPLTRMVWNSWLAAPDFGFHT